MDSSSALRESQFSTRIDVSGPEASRSGYYQTLSDTEAEHHGVSRNRYSGFLSHLRQCFSDVTEDGKLDKFADRGSGWYEGKRARLGEPSLVESGRHAGRSRVIIKEGKSLRMHTWKRDFFTSMLQLRLLEVFGIICTVEFLSWAFWAMVWFVYHHLTGMQCMSGFNTSSRMRSIISAFLFSIETQQTIGYGTRVPKDCVSTVFILAAQCLTQLLLEASCVGLVFARLSHPKNRGRSIFISESAVISRRDGALKFMFRIADVRATQVINPKISAYLYSFGEGRVTAEGERTPVRVEPLKIAFNDGMLLLPLVIEHSIDFTSPLFGHTHDSLVAMTAEVIVTFEGSTETGTAFSARQSYLPGEIHWGHIFAPIIQKAQAPSTHHTVVMSKFHEVEPLPGLTIMTPSELSRKIVAYERNVVPFASVTEATLVLSDDLVVCNRGGQTFLMARVGDTRPKTTVTVDVKAFLYQWKKRVTSEGEVLPYRIKQLELRSEASSPGSHTLEVLLRMPQTVLHLIDKSSPLAAWVGEAEMFTSDSDSEIVFQVTGVKAGSGAPTVAKRTYTVMNNVKWNHHFHVMVKPPSLSGTKPVIDWSLFHTHAVNRHVPSASSSLHAPQSLRDQTASQDKQTRLLSVWGQPEPTLEKAGSLKSGPASQLPALSLAQTASSLPPPRAASSMNSPRHRTKEEAERAESDNGEISLKAVAGPSVSYQDQAYEGRGSSKSSLPEISLYIPTERHQQPSRGAVTELQDSLSSSLLSHSRTYSPSSTSLVGLAPAEWDEELDVASGSRDTSLSNAHHDAVSGGGGPKRDEDWSTKRSLYNICFEPDDFQQSTSE